MKPVLLVCASLGSGGAERQLALIANHWAACGRRVILATFCGPENPDFYPLDARVERVWLGVALARSAWQAPLVQLHRVHALRKLLRRRRPAVVVSFITECNLLTLLAAAGVGVRVVISDRVHPAVDRDVSASWAWLRKRFYRRADLVVAQTARAREWTREHCKVDALVIPNALRPLAIEEQPRESIVLAVGRLHSQKGFDLLLDAFAALAGRFPAWNLLILGAGPERDRLVAQCEALGLQGRVSFPGVVREIEGWMQRAGLVVQPSRYEGFPNVVLEAMALGAPVISSDCLAGPSDMIDDGKNGRLVPVEDAAALAAAMAELMAQPGLRARLGEAARAVRDRFSETSVMRMWTSALDSLQ